MNKDQLLELTKRLDEVISLLKLGFKPVSLFKRIMDGIITVVSILSILSIIDIIKSWIGG